MTALMGLPGVERVDFDQCTQGAKSVKPTSLMGIYLETLGGRLRSAGNSGRCNCAGGHTTLRGRGADGAWNTAPAKQYPADLCGELAAAFYDAIRSRWSDIDGEADFTDLTEDEMELFMPLDPFYDFAQAHDCYTSVHKPAAS